MKAKVKFATKPSVAAKAEPDIFQLDPDISDDAATFGLLYDGTIARVKAEKGIKRREWVSDCALFIHTEIRSTNRDTEFDYYDLVKCHRNF